jgi:hypothetical protein
VKAFSGTTWQSSPHRFYLASHAVDQFRSRRYQCFPCTKQYKVLSCLVSSMLDRIKQFRIHSNQTRQSPCIYLVVLALVFMNRFHLPGVGDDNLVRMALPQSTYPGRMCSNLNCYTALWDRRKQVVQLNLRCCQSTLCKDISSRIYEAVVAILISKVHSYVATDFLCCSCPSQIGLVK